MLIIVIEYEFYFPFSMPNITADIKRIIDSAFQRNFHNDGYWKTNELIDLLYEKTDQNLTDRTIRNYIDRLRADGAPIITKRGLGYKYSDKWSLSENPLSEEDIKNLRSVINILSQFKGFKFFNDAEALINKLQEKVIKSEDTSIIFDTINNVKGLNYIDDISIAINKKQTLSIVYQQFGKKLEKVFEVFPYKLIEYNNRWFVFGKSNNSNKRSSGLGVFALDRINNLSFSNKKFKTEKKEILRNYFSDIIGVTNYEENKVENIKFKVFGVRANYVETKPIHKSLKIEKKTNEYTEFSLRVKVNPELEAFLLNLGNDAEVLAPKTLRLKIIKIITTALSRY